MWGPLVSFSFSAIGLDLDLNFLVEIKLGVPLHPKKVIHFLQGGRSSNPDYV